MAPLEQLEKALRDLQLSAPRFTAMSAESLRQHWRAMIKASHPDLPENRGRLRDAGAINAAYDVLRMDLLARRPHGVGAGAQGDLARETVWRGERVTIAPPWQPDKNAKNHRIMVESYRDVNFFKKRIWELSDRSEEEYHIDAFGQTMFEGRTSVYGNARVFDEMARAMLIWNANGSREDLTRAVLVSPANDSGALYLIYADGRSLAHKPIPLPYDELAGAPSRDKNLQAKLPVVLDRLQVIFSRNAA